MDNIARATRVQEWKKALTILNAEHGINNAEFCRIYGLHPAQLSRHLCGVNSPTWETIDNIQPMIDEELEKHGIDKERTRIDQDNE